MVKPSDLVAEFVALLRLIPELVEQLRGYKENIVAYDDRYPQNVNLQNAIHDMKSPSILVAYQDWGVGSSGPGQPINHRLSIYVRPDVDSSYSDMTRLFVSGVPSGQPLALINTTVDNDLDPMVIEGRCGRQVDSEGVEYWELSISFNEKWG